MKDGTRVRTAFDDNVGTSKGPIFVHSVWWILVKWDDGTQSIVMEKCLEVINESE